MPLAYRIATLLYCFNSRDEVLLLERARDPNCGLWSPCGGKLDTATGESPHACARREAQEEIGLTLGPSDLHLTGLVSESGYEGQAHWLMFLFEVLRPVDTLPSPMREGRFGFVPRERIPDLPLPATDRHHLWPWFWEHRRGFFAAHCDCAADGTFSWRLEQSCRAGTHAQPPLSHPS